MLHSDASPKSHGDALARVPSLDLSRMGTYAGAAAISGGERLHEIAQDRGDPLLCHLLVAEIHEGGFAFKLCERTARVTNALLQQKIFAILGGTKNVPPSPVAFCVLFLPFVTFGVGA